MTLSAISMIPTTFCRPGSETNPPDWQIDPGATGIWVDSPLSGEGGLHSGHWAAKDESVQPRGVEKGSKIIIRDTRLFHSSHDLHDETGDFSAISGCRSVRPKG